MPLPMRSPFSFLLAAALATGCAVGPQYKRPAAPVAGPYIGQAAPAPMGSAAANGLEAWWQRFDDPLLARFVVAALDQNLELSQAQARVAQARAGLGAAHAALLPSGSIQGSAARAYQSVETPLGKLLNGAPGFDRWGSAYEMNLGASWEADLFGGLRRGREAAAADYQAAEAGAVATRLAVAAQTADIYITIRSLQSRLGIAEQQVQTQRKLLALVQRLFAHGIAAEYQVRQAEGALARVQASAPALQTALDAAMNALDVMLGAPPGTHRADVQAPAPTPAAPRIGDMGSPAELLSRRPDLIVAERRLAASNARIGEAMAEYYPRFSLSGMLGSATTVASGNLLTGGASQAAGMFGLRWRLFDFGRIDAQIQLAEGRNAEALAAYRQAALRATEDVENAFSALAKRTEQADTLARAVNALSSARASSFAAYARGSTSLIDVLHADDAVLQATDAQAQAQAEAARAAVAAFRALGGGWQPSSGAAIAAVETGVLK
ncbi:efflux transporter outer membrane subunit [Pseudorhodoferax soli]|uniref:NodT family efflux transporter outer membrane factor (OMF) lipoprotein n=1 Tax=Pseudorhodoferax soli TaxID=545864 RepID=A0A368XML5_9BURK|nr:efflux transporter outer membrane subunit [Pseudorhodoferax soli]RCW69252.1 NodT family efflux transporter outer membrane factor (OMF) lipoprotein [Pseudorhodoferax soli]